MQQLSKTSRAINTLFYGHRSSSKAENVFNATLSSANKESFNDILSFENLAQWFWNWKENIYDAKSREVLIRLEVLFKLK